MQAPPSDYLVVVSASTSTTTTATAASSSSSSSSSSSNSDLNNVTPSAEQGHDWTKGRRFGEAEDPGPPPRDNEELMFPVCLVCCAWLRRDQGWMWKGSEPQETHNNQASRSA